MKRFWTKTPEIPYCIWVSGIGLWISLLAVNKIRKFDRISDEEDRSIIAYHIIIAIFSIKLNGESSWISGSICCTFFSSYSRKPYKQGCSLSYLVQEFCLCPSIVILVYWKKIFYLVTSWVTSKKPWAPAPFACTTLSGILSLSNFASLSMRCTSCRSIGPLGPAVVEF